MKIILSRKGFDSTAGGIASPILPDGTLLSLPIPYENDCNKFSDLSYSGKTYLEIIQELKPSFNKETCHLDPDLRENVKEREDGWKALFGQHFISQKALENNNVINKDLFLFFGWFRQTHLVGNELKYKPDAPDLHLIYGYLQIGNMYHDIPNLPAKFKYHPHAKFENFEPNNCIYEAIDKLTFLEGKEGFGVFNYHDSLVLTKQNQTRNNWKRSLWELPKSIHLDNGISLSSHLKKDRWKKEKDSTTLLSVPRGQEFVFNDNKNEDVKKWCIDLFENKKAN